jgi:hypothetical protein
MATEDALARDPGFAQAYNWLGYVADRRRAHGQSFMDTSDPVGNDGRNTAPRPNGATANAAAVAAVTRWAAPSPGRAGRMGCGKVRRMMQPCRRVLALATALFLAAPLAFATPVREARADAERMALALFAARTPAEAEAVILEVLERIGLGVYTAIGTPIVVGNETDQDDLWLLDVEVEALATAFAEGQLVALDGLASRWRAAGIEVVQDRLPVPITGGIVERALRRVRADVARDPRHPQPFLVLLVDALGDREEFPFDLLDEEEAELGFAAPGEDAAASMMRTMFEQALRDAISDEDPEGAAMFDAALADPATFDAMVAAMMRGDIGAIMTLLMGADVVQELAEAQRELRADAADPDIPEEQRAFLEATDTLLGAIVTPGDDSALAMVEASVATLHATLELQRAQLDAATAELEELLERVMDPETGASGRYSGFVGFTGDAVLLDWQLDEFETFERFVEEQAVALEERRTEHEAAREPGTRLELPWEDDDGSELMLDPLQALLVAVDVLGETRVGRAARPGPPHTASDDFLAQASTSGSCAGIGELAAAHPDGFGAIERLLGVSRQARSVVTELTTGGVKSTLDSLVRSALLAATTRLEVRLEYLPNDAGGASGGIMAPFVERDDRRVVLHAQLHDTLPELLPPRLRDLMQRVGPHLEVCGFLKDIGRDAGGRAEGLADLVDAVQRLADGRDLSNVPIVVDLAGEAWPLLHVRRVDWDGQRGASPMSMIARTDAAGSASGPLLPRLQSPDVGGRLQVEAVPVRVQAILTESADAFWNRGALASQVAEELLRPVQTWVRVHVGRYLPQPIRGSMTLSRTVVERGDVETTVDDRHDRVMRNGLYTLSMQVDDAVLVGGAGALATTGLALPVGPSVGRPATLTATIGYELFETRFETWKGDCDGVPATFTRTTVTDTTFAGRGAGPSPSPVMEVASASSTYLVQPALPLAAVLATVATGAWSGSTNVETTSTGCDGTTTTTDERPAALTEDGLKVLVSPENVPGAHRRPFERAATRLVGAAEWQFTKPWEGVVILALRSGRGYPDVTFDVATTVRWEMNRGE